MAVLNVNLTRIESMNLKKSLKTAGRGHKLLKDKLDELIKKLLELVKQNQVLRNEVDIKEIKKFYNKINEKDFADEISNIFNGSYKDLILYLYNK